MSTPRIVSNADDTRKLIKLVSLIALSVSPLPLSDHIASGERNRQPPHDFHAILTSTTKPGLEDGGKTLNPFLNREH